MTELRFTIPGRAVGKKRPRVFIQGKGRNAKPRAVTPKATRAWEYVVEKLAKHALANYGPPRVWWEGDGYYSVSVKVYIAHTKKGKPSKTAPDLDNVIKSVLDGLEGIAYGNDRQVVGIVDSWIRHGCEPEEERTEVVLCELGGNSGI